MLSQLTWQLPQQLAGVLYAETATLFGGVESVKSFHGALLVRTNFGDGLTLGNVITNSNPNDDNKLLEIRPFEGQEVTYGPDGCVANMRSGSNQEIKSTFTSKDGIFQEPRLGLSMLTLATLMQDRVVILGNLFHLKLIWK